MRVVHQDMERAMEAHIPSNTFVPQALQFDVRVGVG